MQHENEATPPSLPPRPKNSSVPGPSIPPQRAQSDVVLEAQKPNIEKQVKSSIDVNGHYAHLDKHLKEVRRRKKTSKPLMPSLSNFQLKKENEQTVSTDWIQYIKAWIEFIISSAAYDEIDRPLEPFSLSNIKHDVDRLYPMVLPFVEPIKMIRPIYRWENKAFTGTLAGIYMLLWYYDLLLASMCLGAIAGILLIRLDMFAEYGVDALEQQPEAEATVKSWDRSLWMKMKTRMKVSDDSDIATDISLVEWRNKIYTKHGPKIQVILSDTVDYIERIKNLVTWKRPTRTRFLLILMGFSCFLLAVIPLRFVAKMIPLYIGFEFFVLQALRSHYPRHRRLFNILNLLLWNVPNDAEYALEVVRLSHTSNAQAHEKEMTPSASTSSSAPSTETPGLRRRDPHPGDLASTSSKSFSSMSEISDTLFTSVAERVSKPQENATLQESITANVKTLALLATASAVTKVKNSMDKKGEGKEEEANNRATEEDSTNAFGCMYQGTIPGRIILHDRDFVFQTSRMTGGRVLVKYAYNDIVGVKKTKQYNVGFWHSNGLDISLEDGTTLKFEHVLKRDDCFNNLVSASNEEGSEWKKM